METTTVYRVITEAVRNGACEKSAGATDWKTLVWLFFTPQGTEFCAEHSYPAIDQFRAMSENVRKYGVFVDAGVIEEYDRDKIGVIGATEATLTYTDPTSVHKVIIMHGARARLIVGRYAVVRLYEIGENNVEIENDGTAVILR